jgi:hypothetical protein
LIVAANLAMRWSFSSIWNNPGFLEFASALSTLILIMGAVIEEWPKLARIGLLIAKLITFRITAFEWCVLKKLVAHSTGAILVVLGIVGELVFETRTFIVEDKQTVSDELQIAQLTKENLTLQGQVGDTAEKLRLANERFAAIETRANALDAQIDAASSRLLKTERSVSALTPRWQILEKNKATLIDALKPYLKQKFLVVNCADDRATKGLSGASVLWPERTESESEKTGLLLSSLLKGTHEYWGRCATEGIVIEYMASDESIVRSANALHEVLSRIEINNVEHPTPDLMALYEGSANDNSRLLMTDLTVVVVVVGANLQMGANKHEELLGTKRRRK